MNVCKKIIKVYNNAHKSMQWCTQRYAKLCTAVCRVLSKVPQTVPKDGKNNLIDTGTKWIQKSKKKSANLTISKL